MVAVNAITIDQLNYYYYYVLSYSFNILSPLSLSLSVRLQPRGFCCRGSLGNPIDALLFVFLPSFTSPRVLRSRSALSLSARHQPQVTRISLSLSLSLYLSAPHQPKAASHSAHNWRSVAFSLSRPPLSLYRCAISSKMRQPPLRVLHSLSLGPLVLSLSPFSRRRLGQLMHNC